MRSRSEHRRFKRYELTSLLEVSQIVHMTYTYVRSEALRLQLKLVRPPAGHETHHFAIGRQPAHLRPAELQRLLFELFRQKGAVLLSKIVKR